MIPVAVTGVGAITPIGLTMDATWTSMLSGEPGIRPITRFDSFSYPTRLAGEICGFDGPGTVGSRLIPQMDRSTQLSFAAAAAAIAESGLEAGSFDAYAAGVTTANFAGGFEFGERELRQLWLNGPAYVSAYQSFAWFYAVNTGQLSIHHGFKGAGGAVVADECGGIESVALAANNIMEGTPIQLAGAVDYSLCSWGMASLSTRGTQSVLDDPDCAYLPFDARAAGSVPGEGGALFVLEDLDYAERRGAVVRARIVGHAASFDPDPQSTAGISRCILTALTDARLSPHDIDLVLPDAAGNLDDDNTEAQALCEVFGERAVPIAVPKTLTGRLLSGGSALDIAWAIRALQAQEIPAAINIRARHERGLDIVVGQTRKANLNHALVLARGFGGLCSALVVERR